MGGWGGGEGEGGEIALIHCNTDQIQCSNLSFKATHVHITSKTAVLLCTKLENAQNSWSSAVRMQPAALGSRAGAAPQPQPRLCRARRISAGRVGTPGLPQPASPRHRKDRGSKRSGEAAGWPCGYPGTPSAPSPAAEGLPSCVCTASAAQGGSSPPRTRGAGGCMPPPCSPLVPRRGGVPPGTGVSGAGRAASSARRGGRPRTCRDLHGSRGGAQVGAWPPSPSSSLPLSLSPPALLLSRPDRPCPCPCPCPVRVPDPSFSVTAPCPSLSASCPVSLPVPVLFSPCPLFSRPLSPSPVQFSSGPLLPRLCLCSVASPARVPAPVRVLAPAPARTARPGAVSSATTAPPAEEKGMLGALRP